MQSENGQNIFPDSKLDLINKKTLVTIFDWDNTLFCTDYLKMHNIDYKLIFSSQKSLDEVAIYLKNQIKELEYQIISLFDVLISKYNSKIFIVTNADILWISNCLSHFMDELKEYTEKNEIIIYSAKSLYSKFPIERWKVMCFRQVIFENIKDKENEVIVVAVGDSNAEKKAALALKQMNFFYSIKVKFIETRKSPDINVIIKQFQEIQNQYSDVCKGNNFNNILSRNSRYVKKKI